MKTTLSVFIRAFGLLGLLAVFLLPAWAASPTSTADSFPTDDGVLKIQPINHATLVLQWKDTVLYVDPVGGAKIFRGAARPNLILVTDIHGDHFSKETIAELMGPATKLVGPPAVVELLPSDLRGRATSLANGQTGELLGIRIEAMPAYNLTADRERYHAKGRGNGYVLTLGGKRLYLSGDTEDIPEMLALRNIDVAFLCMNLPYTMDVTQAVHAVRTFKPRVVYPYHYRGSDLAKFKEGVATDLGIEVRLRDWYPKP